MYRLIATDIDDTILSPDGTLPETNRQALERLHSRGIAVVLSSGRATVSMQTVAAGILPPADDEYLISFNGARVSTLLSGHILFEKVLSPATVKAVMEYARAEGLLVQGYPREDGFITERRDRKSDIYTRETGMPYKVVPDLPEALPEGSPKLLIIDDPERLPTHQKRLRELAEGTFDVLSSKRHYLEIVPAGVSKGDALIRLAEHLEIPIEETIAVGDSLNDVEMLRAAGLGVAVANARSELKTVADVVLERTAADGAIAEVEERFWGA